MKIIFIPGLSSPNCDQYKPVYDPLLQEAIRRYPKAKSEVLLLPGQLDTSGCINGEFLIPEAAFHLRSVLETETATEHFLIARSSGCTVVAELLATWKEAPVKKVVFWGPPPFWLYHDMFASGEGPFYEKARTTGVQITKKILVNCTPWESNIAKFSQPLLLATGTKDIFCPPVYIEYIVKTPAAQTRTPAIEVGKVDGPHSITPDMPCWSDYCRCVLEWLE